MILRGKYVVIRVLGVLGIFYYRVSDCEVRGRKVIFFFSLGFLIIIRF